MTIWFQFEYPPNRDATFDVHIFLGGRQIFIPFRMFLGDGNFLVHVFLFECRPFIIHMYLGADLFYYIHIYIFIGRGPTSMSDVAVPRISIAITFEL